MHLSPEMFMRVVRGEVSAEGFVRAAYRHLVETCDDCRAQWEAYQVGTEPRSDGEPPSMGVHGTGTASGTGVSGRELAHQEERLKEMRRQRRKARRDLSFLLDLPAEDRRTRIETARSRFRSPAFVELLLEECRRIVPSRPREARQLAALVPVALHWMAGTPDPAWSARATARARALEANALRVTGELREAGQVFAELRSTLSHRPVFDDTVMADVDSLEASLCIDQDRYDDARLLLERASELFRRAGDGAGVARVRIQHGNVCLATHRYPAALASMQEALASVDPAEHRFLVQCAVTGLINALCELGRAPEAAELLHSHEEVYDATEESRLQRLGMLGRIAMELDEPVEGERWFSRCRDGFLELGRNFDAALATLDIAQALLAQGRTAELRVMVTEVVEVFRARKASRGILSALFLLHRSLAAETVTAGLLGEIRERLESGGG